MDPTGKALWFIENHFAEPITLDDIATVAGVSRYHLSRVFGIAFGHTVIGYLRARRLAEAARQLARGAPDILTVALDAGYNSHEAFTRAFRDQFGLTPEAIRARRHLNNISIMEPIKMDETLLATLEPPRLVHGRTLLIAGLSERCDAATSAGIPAQWQRFAPHIGHIPGHVGWTTYGVLCPGDDSGNRDYVCGVEVSDFSRIPAELTRLRIPEQLYAVFRHHGHVSTIRRTWFTIFNQWLPESGHAAADAPELEVYGEGFDPATGNGGLEVWIPLRVAEPRVKQT